MTNLNFTIDDVMAEIQRLNACNPEGFATCDMSATTGKSNAWCRVHIKKMIQAGKLRFNGFAIRPRIDGRMATVPIYQAVCIDDT